jgi:hypothetical protein
MNTTHLFEMDTLYKRRLTIEYVWVPGDPGDRNTPPVPGRVDEITRILFAGRDVTDIADAISAVDPLDQWGERIAQYHHDYHGDD